MDALNEAFALIGVVAPVDDPEDDNKNPWVFVAPRIRNPPQGPRPQPVEIPPPEDICNEEILWVQTGRTIRQKRKLSMARKGGMCGRFVYIYGTYGPYGFEY